MNYQIFNDPESNMFIMIGIWFVMSSLSLASFQKYSNEGLVEFFERSFGQYNMFIWGVNVLMLFITHDAK